MLTPRTQSVGGAMQCEIRLETRKPKVSEISDEAWFVFKLICCFCFEIFVVQLEHLSSFVLRVVIRKRGGVIRGKILTRSLT